MEDSEQRKKRLKEMRLQADRADVSGSVEGFGMPGYLSNPLIEAPSTVLPDASYASPRSDFYTDSIGRFSSNNRSNTKIQTSQGYFPPPNIGSFPMAQISPTHPGTTSYCCLLDISIL